MAVRVLVVDDSGFFRRRVTEMLSSDPGLEVVGAASNGQEALEQVTKLRPDVITMDIEMPVMDGITATRRIMDTRPTPIIMFSSLTTDGAKATLDALDAGALDFLPKRFEDISSDQAEAKRTLCERVRNLAYRPVTKPRTATATTAKAPVSPLQRSAATTPAISKSTASAPSSSDIKLVVIGTSTGGPVALQEVLTKLPKSFPVPILLVQHMPGTFTPAFAQRLNGLCEISIKEAADGDVLQNGHAYLAPGGKQMLLEKKGTALQIRVIESDAKLTYKPSVDVTFGSIARVYPSQTLAIVLTGMGADGREGARLLKQGGSKIWTQDEKSCVVYGMPAAVKEAGLSDRELALQDVGAVLAHIS